LLLNTDLHIAEISTRMSRTQFVRNTMSVVMPQRQQSLAAEFEAAASSSNATEAPAEGAAGIPTIRMRSKRSGSIQSWKSISRDHLPGAINESSSSLHNSAEGKSSGAVTPLTEQPLPTVYPMVPRGWEMEVESTLKVNYFFLRRSVF
jgi:hypothetical protein